jgi:hypothetical protein
VSPPGSPHRAYVTPVNYSIQHGNKQRIAGFDPRDDRDLAEWNLVRELG